jgi:hypothetical protein
MTKEKLQSKFNTVRLCIDGPGECVDCDEQIDMVWDAIHEARRLAEEWRDYFFGNNSWTQRPVTRELPWEVET